NIETSISASCRIAADQSRNGSTRTRPFAVLRPGASINNNAAAKPSTHRQVLARPDNLAPLLTDVGDSTKLAETLGNAAMPKCELRMTAAPVIFCKWTGAAQRDLAYQ